MAFTVLLSSSTFLRGCDERICTLSLFVSCLFDFQHMKHTHVLIPRLLLLIVVHTDEQWPRRRGGLCRR
jgi:hypothetical protein